MTLTNSRQITTKNYWKHKGVESEISDDELRSNQNRTQKRRSSKDMMVLFDLWQWFVCDGVITNLDGLVASVLILEDYVQVVVDDDDTSFSQWWLLCSSFDFLCGVYDETLWDLWLWHSILLVFCFFVYCNDDSDVIWKKWWKVMEVVGWCEVMVAVCSRIKWWFSLRFPI